jgi:hypothetical protein
MTTMEMTVAKTILEQMGGHRMLVMTGALHLVGGEDLLQFKFRGSRAANCVRVVLDPSDTYTVTFYKSGHLKCTPVKEIEGVHGEDLRRIFEDFTKLRTSL